MFNIHNATKISCQIVDNYISNYNHGHNIIRISDVLPNFPFTTSEMEPDY